MAHIFTWNSPLMETDGPRRVSVAHALVFYCPSVGHFSLLSWQWPVSQWFTDQQQCCLNNSGPMFMNETPEHVCLHGSMICLQQFGN